jgi:two-component system response regulator YesN
MKLLILDDDTQIREGLRYGIDWKSLEFDEVRSAGDGVSGLIAAREMAPDIVLSDVRMPGMDGLEFLNEVKGIFPLIKVVLISGYDDFEYLQKAVRYHADGYELKPVKMRDLLALINELKEKIRTEGNSTEYPEKRGTKEKPRKAYSFRINKAIDYVNAHLASDLSARNLGEVLQISPNYFSCLFKRETGDAFSDFVIRSRLEAAAYLLEHTDQRISEIAALTGFRDSVYFSQAFKKAYGRSPSKYRMVNDEET